MSSFVEYNEHAEQIEKKLSERVPLLRCRVKRIGEELPYDVFSMGSFNITIRFTINDVDHEAGFIVSAEYYYRFESDSFYKYIIDRIAYGLVEFIIDYRPKDEALPNYEA